MQSYSQSKSTPVLLQHRCIRRCEMLFACSIIALLEVRNQFLQKQHDVLVFEFDEQAWSQLQLAGANCPCPTNSMLECPPSVILHQAVQCQLQCCYGIQLFVFYKPMKSTERYAIQHINRQISYESGGLEQSLCAFYYLIPNATTLSVVTCVLNVA